MLGLDENTVVLVEYTSRWCKAFELERFALQNALGTVARDIQHIGSTAIPGLDAKPILDVAVAVAERDEAAICIAPLAVLGYVYHSDLGDAGGHLFMKGPGEKRTHYLHIVARNDLQWRHYLLFRDYLRLNREALETYRDCKRGLERCFSKNRPAYTRAKTDVILQLIGQASTALMDNKQ